MAEAGLVAKGTLCTSHRRSVTKIEGLEGGGGLRIFLPALYFFPYLKWIQKWSKHSTMFFETPPAAPVTSTLYNGCYTNN